MNNDNLTIEERKKLIRELAADVAEKLCKDLDDKKQAEIIILLGPYLSLITLILNRKFNNDLWLQAQKN